MELYCCYSIKLREFLFVNGLKYKLAALNPNSHKLFWVYIKDEKLDRLLSEWSKKNNFYVQILEVNYVWVYI